MVELPRRSVKPGRARGQAAATHAPAPAPISAELAAAIEAVTQVAPVSTATPFITAMQREAVARELQRRARLRYAKFAGVAAALLFLVHLAVTRLLWAAPADAAVQAHAQPLPEAVLPLFSSLRHPLQADNVAIVQADRISANHYRYVAAVTLRLRKPLYTPAITNGTANYRRLQEAVDRARDQELRLKLTVAAETPEPPSLPLLLRRTHQAGETIVVRVPFQARRFGWRWRIESAQVALNVANRVLEGDSLDRYADAAYLIFGDAKTLADIRARTKLATAYVQAVTKEVQRHANGEAVAESTRATSFLANLPAFDLAPVAHAPAAELAHAAAAPQAQAPAPELAHAPATDEANAPASNPAPAVAEKVAQPETTPAFDPDAPAVVAETVRFVAAAQRGSR